MNKNAHSSTLASSTEKDGPLSVRALALDGTLDQAIYYAARFHKGQVDKAGEPFILHPLRVMLSLETPEERIVGVLHDVVEDCTVTLDDLRWLQFPEEIIEAIDSLSRREGEQYASYILRVSLNPIARRVKLADLKDNTDPNRTSTAKLPMQQLARYKRAIQILESREGQVGTGQGEVVRSRHA